MATLFLSTGVTLANPVSAGEEVMEKYAVALSQQKKVTITGIVKDALGPVVGANVVEKGTTNGTVTDMEGHFSLQVSSNAVLVVRLYRSGDSGERKDLFHGSAERRFTGFG
jgi:hypothetical protein